jgi:O-antigen ligase
MEYVSFLPQQVMQMLLLLILIAYLFFLPKEWVKLKPNSIASVLIIMSVILSIIFSPHIKLSLRYLLSFLVVFLPVCLYIIEFGSRSLYRFLTVFLISVLFVSLFYIIIFPQYGIMSGNHFGAYRGVFLHKNVFGIFCAVTSLFCITAVLLNSQSKIKFFYMLVYVICMFLVLQSKSTTSVVLFFLSNFIYVFFFLFSKIRSLTSKVIVYYTVLGILLFFLFTFSIYYENIVYALGKDPTLTGRTDLWEVLFYIAMDRPIFGHGLGLFYRSEIMYQYSIEFGWGAKSTHNSYLDLLLGIGIIGLFSFLYFVFNLLIKYPAVKLATPLETLCYSGLILCLLFGFFEAGAFISSNVIWILNVFFIARINEVLKKRY